jgi:hypothetical protein
MDAPSLITDWTEEELAEQRAKWQQVASLSEQISISAQASDWQTLLPLAVKRQTLIDQFFQQPICLPLFQTITDQMAAMQRQHEVVANLVKLAIVNNESHATSLNYQRNQLAELARPQ